MSTMTKTRSIRNFTNYMDQAFDPSLDDMIKTFLEKTGHLKFDTIVGTGLSGALVVPTIARALGLKWAIVRKQDGAHSPNKVEGELGERWLFVDDFVASGTTLARAQDAIANWVYSHNNPPRYSWSTPLPHPAPFSTQYVGTYQYARNGALYYDRY